MVDSLGGGTHVIDSLVVPSFQNGRYRCLGSTVGGVARVGALRIVPPHASHETRIDAPRVVSLRPTMTESTIVVGGEFLNVGNVVADKHVDAGVDPNETGQILGHFDHVFPQTLGNVRQGVVANVKALDGTDVLGTGLKVNVVTGSVGSLRTARFETPVLVETVKVSVEFGVARTSRSAVVDGRDGSNLAVKDVKLVFGREGLRTGVTKDEFLHENLGGSGVQSGQVRHDVAELVDGTTEQLNATETVGQDKDTVSGMVSGGTNDEGGQSVSGGEARVGQIVGTVNTAVHVRCVDTGRGTKGVGRHLVFEVGEPKVLVQNQEWIVPNDLVPRRNEIGKGFVVGTVLDRPKGRAKGSWFERIAGIVGGNRHTLVVVGTISHGQEEVAFGETIVAV